MVSDKRFIVESVMITNDCNEDKSRIVKVITDKEELYSYDDLYEISDLLNELAEENELLKSIRESQQQMILKLYEENEQLRNSMKKLENVDLVIELKYSYGYGGYLADVRVVDHE